MTDVVEVDSTSVLVVEEYVKADIVSEATVSVVEVDTADIVVEHESSIEVVEVFQGIPGPPGSGGGSGFGAIRHDYVASGYGISYMGVAAAGSLESASVWTVTRITFTASGVVAESVQAVGIAWADHLTAVYS